MARVLSVECDGDGCKTEIWKTATPGVDSPSGGWLQKHGTQSIGLSHTYMGKSNNGL